VYAHFTAIVCVSSGHLLHSRSHSIISSASHRIGNSLSAAGATDYGFLYTGHSSMGHMTSFRVRSILSREAEDETKKPSIDDFDGEISIFKVDL